MATSIQRLTLFALISALEIDLRDFIELYIVPVAGDAELLPVELNSKCTGRFIKINPTETPTVVDLLEYLDLGDSIQILRRTDNLIDASTRSYLKKYYHAIDILVPIRNRVMHSRPLEFDDLMRVSDLSRTLIKAHPSLWANLRTTIRKLDQDPEFASTITIPEAEADSAIILHNLPQPDFDDTGFMGREKELASLKSALGGTYPIVTVVGEGGLGKTALALKACYDFLDENTLNFDAIVWTSAKTSKLTVNEIQLIDGAITSSLGIIESAAAPLGRQTGTEGIDDLIAHLANNRILLVIDNLETVIDDTIKLLVSRMPSGGSKILFTTRLGLGAFDFPIPLFPLNKKDASSYFRAVARVFSVNDLATLSNDEVDEYCAKLLYNTLYIKWFIHSVSVGKRPTVLIANPTHFLQFCLQNVFNSLNSDVKLVATILANLGELQTIASLAYYSDLDCISIQGALSILITSNLVTPERGRSAEDEDRYRLSALARTYIHRFLRMDLVDQRRLISKQNEMRSTKEEMSARAGTDIFDWNSVFVRDQGDYIVAKILTKATHHLFRKDFSLANSELERAEDLSPNYFEVHRVRALYNVFYEDFFAADASYKSAISLAPQRAPLRLWYGGFLSRNMRDNEGALEQLREAERLAPTAVIVKHECARILQYMRRFDDADACLRPIQNLESQPSRTRRVHLDLLSQNNTRQAEYKGQLGQFVEALVSLERAREIVTAAPTALIDQRMIKALNHPRRIFPSLRWAFKGLPEEERLRKFEEWLPFPTDAMDVAAEQTGVDEAGRVTKVAEGSDANTKEVVASDMIQSRGRVMQLHQNYGFIDASGTRYFFHRREWVGSVDFAELDEGTIVQFVPARAVDGRLTAVKVEPLHVNLNSLLPGTTVTGYVKALYPAHGFIKLWLDGDLFFHRTHCASDVAFETLSVGEKVRCHIGIGRDGRNQGQDVHRFTSSIRK